MDEVAEIKHRLEVAEVVGSYLPLKQAGRNLKASCPFHSEKTASFMVSPDKNIWHCFGCGEGGDIFKFVMKMEGLEFRDALELLARRAGVELKSRPVDKASAQAKERLYQALALAAKYYQASLVKNPQALDYVIKQRRFNKQTIQDFMIGYAPDSWEAVTKFLLKKGFSAAELLKAGLAGQKSGRSSIYDLCRGRIMLTISDPQGRPIGFSGRVLDEPAPSSGHNDSLSGAAAESTGPKYINTAQTALYDKSRVIYGWHLAKPAIREADEAVLVEGNMDVIASHQSGIKQVVAASGTALTPDQLRAISKLTKNVKLAFDQDQAGLVATERAIELGQKLGLTLKIIEVTGAKDPDELIAQNPKLWEQAIAQAKPIMDYLFNRFAAEYDLSSAVGKRLFTDRLAANVKRLADPVEQDHYVQLLAERTGTSLDAIKKKLEVTKEPRLTVTAHRLPPQKAVPKAQDASAKVEEAILGVNLAWPGVRLSLHDLRERNFSDPDRQRILAALTAAGQNSAEAIIKALPELADYVKILTLKGEQEFDDLAPADRSFEAFTLAKRLIVISNKKAKQDLSQQLKAAEAAGDVQLAHSLLQQYQTLIREEG
jgi:DNA primase